MHERQRDELGEAAGLLLQVARDDHVPGPGVRALDASVHDRDVRVETDAVGLAVALQPLLCVHLVAADDRADLVVEDLGGRAGQRGEPRILQPQQVVAQRLTVAPGALGDLERREAVNVHVGHSALHRTRHVDVVVAVEVRVDAALQGHFCGTEGSGLHGTVRDVVERQQVGGAAQVERHRPLREPAEAALVGAHVRVVDVAVVDPRDGVSHCVKAELVGVVGDEADLRAPGAEQVHDLVVADLLACAVALDDLGDASPCRRPRVRHHLRRLHVGTGVPLGGLVPDENHFRAVVDDVGGGDALGPHGTRVVTPQRLRVRAVHHGEAQLLVQPLRGPGGELGVDGQPRREREAAVLGDAAQDVERGPRALRVHVVGGDGRDAAPVVDAGIEQDTEVVAEIRRCLQVHRRRQQQACHGDRPEVLVLGARLRPVHRRAGLRQEVLHDHLLEVAPLPVRGGQQHQRLDAVASGLPDAHEDPAREGDAQLPGCAEGVDAALGLLVGRTAVALEVVAQRLEHHPLRGGDPPEQRELIGVQRAGVRVGQEPGLVEHELCHVVQVVHRGVIAVGAQPVRRHFVAQLGPLAQGEEGLVAAGARTLPGDREDLVGRHVRLLEARGRLGERAVAALVAAQHGERDEDLRGEGDPGAVGRVAHCACTGHEVPERGVDEIIDERVVGRGEQLFARVLARQDSTFQVGSDRCVVPVPAGRRRKELENPPAPVVAAPPHCTGTGFRRSCRTRRPRASRTWRARCACRSGRGGPCG